VTSDKIKKNYKIGKTPLKIKDNIIIAKKHFFEKFVQYLMSVFQT
jgi:hypothetical protein